MSVLTRENILASCGNYGLYDADLDVFNADGSTNVSPGQLVIWDPVTKKSLGPTLTVSDNERIVISVGVDRFTLRSGYGDMLFGNNIFAATAEASACGTSPVYDILFNCAETDEEYTINISVKDEASINSYPYNKMPTYSYTVKVSDFACASCTNGLDTHALACAFRDAINEKRNASFKKRSTFAPSRTRAQAKGFTAHILYGADTPDSSTNATTKVFCISPVTDSCTKDCIRTDTEILKASFGGDDYTLEYSVDPLDNTKTYLSQLQGIVDQITVLLDGKGSAVVTKGFGNCCSRRLEVNSCYNDFALLTAADAPIVPCEEYNPFDPDFSPATANNDCKNCTSEATAPTFTSGIRIIGDAIDTTCSCNPNLNPEWMKHRELSIAAVKGFRPGSTYVREIVKPTPPKNLAYDWIVRDYMSDAGGKGRDHDAFEHRNYGAAGYPLGKGRSGAISKCLGCAGTVCSYVIEHGLPHMDGSIYGKPANALGRTVVLIPSGDATTRSEFEALINAYIVTGAGPLKTTITCASDQDQVENGELTNRYPDSNGYIL